ncbi:VOC family protein [Oceanobacillus sp. 1P07AA]|uniref:VOC family protein n=1 Tax=Oceanobacillus sp. 1P07AA TaxID=3132293 RepID=UPI0039A4A7BA
MQFHHMAIEVTDLDRSKKFYQLMFDLDVEQYLIFGDEQIVFLKRKEWRLELIQSSSPPSHSPYVHFCFQINNLDETIINLKSNKIEPIEGPYEISNGWKSIFFHGPDQEIIELLQIKNT